MTSQINLNLHTLKDEYLENKTRYQETKSEFDKRRDKEDLKRLNNIYK